jgi:hypothetical protein
MTSIPHSTVLRAPPNLAELFLRDLTSLLVTSRAVTRSLEALRPECTFSPEVTTQINDLIGASASGEQHMRAPLNEAGMVLAPAGDPAARAQVAAIFTQLPAGGPSSALAEEVTVNLRLVAQHLELRARLAAEEALRVGQKSIGQALLRWARSWCQCGEDARAALDRARERSGAPGPGAMVAAPSS